MCAGHPRQFAHVIIDGNEEAADKCKQDASAVCDEWHLLPMLQVLVLIAANFSCVVSEQAFERSTTPGGRAIVSGLQAQLSHAPRGGKLLTTSVRSWL